MFVLFILITFDQNTKSPKRILTRQGPYDYFAFWLGLNRNDIDCSNSAKLQYFSFGFPFCTHVFHYSSKLFNILICCVFQIISRFDKNIFLIVKTISYCYYRYVRINAERRQNNNISNEVRALIISEE